MCNIYEFDQSKLIRDGCTRCMIDCYRDPSVLQFVAISASDAYHILKKGRVFAAAKNVFDRRNLTSLKAVWDDRKWIEGLNCVGLVEEISRRYLRPCNKLSMGA